MGRVILRKSLDASYFADVYARHSDPWRFATSAYERNKYRATLAALGERRFKSGLEIGCSIGVLTAKLARVCDALLAIDIDSSALENARVRNRRAAHVRFEKKAFPHDVPPERFDLVVVSEVAYYWGDDDLAAAREKIARLAPGGMIELVHFTPYVADYPRSGDDVHEAFLSDERFERVSSERARRFRIDVLRVR